VGVACPCGWRGAGADAFALHAAGVHGLPRYIALQLAPLIDQRRYARLNLVGRRPQQASGPGLPNCEDCNAEIPLARRQALPGARLCIACQSARE
jgi:phage/conjugal plasmid C-4 type zinc finger TraR family protein